MNQEQLKAYLLYWSKNRLSKLADEVIPEFRANPNRYAALHELAIAKDNYPYQEYASWISGHLTDRMYSAKYPKRIQEVVDAFFETKNHTVRRNLLKIVLAVPSHYREGELLDKLFSLLMSADEAIAVRSYAFHKVLSFMDIYPELQRELDAVLDTHHALFQSAAMRSCLKRYDKWNKTNEQCY